MKIMLTAFVIALFATAVTAGDVYHGLANGNSDLFDQHGPADHPIPVQPSVGDGFQRYQGLADGNPDLFKSGPVDSTRSEDPRVYMGFSGNPDISY